MEHSRKANLKVLPPVKFSSLDIAADTFYLDCQSAPVSEHTLEKYQRCVGAFVTWLQEHGVTELKQITANHVRAWYVELANRDYNPTTVFHYASVLRTFLNFCVDEGMLDASPQRRVRMPRLPKKLLPSFSKSEIDALLRACQNNRDRAVILFLLDTGCRVEEFVRLHVGDIDGKSGAVHIREGKGKKERVTYLGVQGRKALNKYLLERKGVSSADWLWLGEKGEPLSIRGVQHLLERVAKRAGVEDCHPHKFRHTFALWSLRQGMDVFALAKLMGHEDLAVLQKYVNQAREDLEAAHSKHGPVDNML